MILYFVKHEFFTLLYNQDDHFPVPWSKSLWCWGRQVHPKKATSKVHFFNIVYPLLSRGVVFARDSPHILSFLGKKPYITGKTIILWVRKIFVWRNWSRNKGVRAKTSFRHANKISRATQGGKQK